jgi:hypothetical protein
LELRQYETKGDVETYREKLLIILDLASKAIHVSLEEYTMGKYLQATNGIFRNETRSGWEVEAVANLLCTNNAAERPFGIAKAYCKIYPSMSLRTLAGYSLGIANGSHRAPGTRGKQKRTAHVKVFEGGAAFTSAPEVRTAVTKVCGVRRVKKGTVTILLDKVYDTNCENAALRRETKRLDGIEEQRRKDATKGVKFNTAMNESLAPDKLSLEAHIKMLGNAKGAFDFTVLLCVLQLWPDLYLNMYP